MYVQGENPAMSDPNLNHARGALSMLEHLVVQDIFLTETAGFADVIFPASAFPEKSGTFTNSNRQVQLGRQAMILPGTHVKTGGSYRKWRDDLVLIGVMMVLKKYFLKSGKQLPAWPVLPGNAYRKNIL